MPPSIYFYDKYFNCLCRSEINTIVDDVYKGTSESSKPLKDFHEFRRKEIDKIFEELIKILNYIQNVMKHIL